MKKYMKRISIGMLAALLLTACGTAPVESSSVPISSVPVSTESSVEAPASEESVQESVWSTIDLKVPKLSDAQEESSEVAEFSLYLPEGMSASYEWGGEPSDTPIILGQNDWYIQIAPMSTGIDETSIASQAETEGGRVEMMQLNGKKVILAIIPSEKYSAVNFGAKLADGYLYTYNLFLEDGYVLPMSFFSETEDAVADQEFRNVVNTFKPL